MKKAVWRLRDWWGDPYREKPKWTDRAIAFLTIGIVALAYMQWQEMHSGGSDTHDLAVAAGQQAKRMKELAEKMKVQADNTFTLGKAAQEANSIAERQIRIAQRPWLKVVFLGDDPEHAKEAYNETRFVVGGALKIPLRIVNLGKTPAFHVVGNFVVEFVPVGKEPKNIPDGHNKRRRIAVQQARTSVVYQDGGFFDIPIERVGDLGNGKIGNVAVTDEESRQMNSKIAYAVVWGRVRYSDAFGVSTGPNIAMPL